MSTDTDEPLTLSRSDLYELVWSKPVQELAKDFGISDVALAKRCRRLQIPVPGRGYWARIAAGQSPRRPRLPDRKEEWHDHSALAVPPPSQSNDTKSLPEAAADSAWLADRIAFEQRSENAIQAPAVIKVWDPVVRAHRDRLEAAAREMRTAKRTAEREEKRPEHRRRFGYSSDAWRWTSVRDRGQRLDDTHKASAFRVSLDCYERAVRIVNTIALSAKARGFTIQDDLKEGRIVLIGYDAEMRLRITEQLEERIRKRIRYDGKMESESYKVPTGRLRLTLQLGYREAPVFKDSDTQQLESLLNKFFVAACRLVVRSWQCQRAQRESQRRYEEERQRRAEADRIRAERERQAAEERLRREALVAEANRWAQAGLLREYLRHVRDVAGGSSQWLAWAQQVADEIDPTSAHESLHAPD